MSDDDAFVAAIQASPDDAVLRLVYADWLDEHDDPRGTLLRLELELFQRTPADPDYATLRRQFEDLDATIDIAWRIAVCRLPHEPPIEPLPAPPVLDFFDDYIQQLVEVEVPRIRAGTWWDYGYLLILVVWAMLVVKLVGLYVSYPALLW